MPQNQGIKFMETKIKQFRIVAFLEGWSFLILLFIAMPLKYMLGILIATKIVGMLHGVLFIWFVIALFGASSEQKWGMKLSILAFIASILPFGTFFLDKTLKPLDNNNSVFGFDK
jgi:integral membrane protein